MQIIAGEFHAEDKRMRRKLVLVSLLTGAKFCNWANEELQLLVWFPNVLFYMLPARMAFHCRVAVVQTTHHGTVGSMGCTTDVYLMPRVYWQQLPG